MAEIEVWGTTDQSRDPAGDLAKLADLEARVMADGRVPPMERGLLASAVGAAHFYVRDYNKAADRYGEAAVLFEEAKAPPEEMAGLYNNQAAILASIGRYAEAEQSHLKALAIRRGMEGERGPKVASSLFGLASSIFARAGWGKRSSCSATASASRSSSSVPRTRRRSCASPRSARCSPARAARPRRSKWRDRPKHSDASISATSIRRMQSRSTTSAMR